MPPRKSAMIKGVDLIGEGSLIVVEPSAINRKEYVWVEHPAQGIAPAPAWLIGRSKARGMRRGNRPSERPESTNGPEHVHMATDRTATPFRPPETPPDGYSPRDRPAGKGDGPVSGPRTRLPPQPIDSIILIALACFLGDRLPPLHPFLA